MYTNNLFTLNNIPTLSTQWEGGAGEKVCASDGGSCADFSIYPSDRVFVSVVQYGRTVLEKVVTGVASVAEIMDSVRQAMGKTSGLFTVSIRNASQGWLRRRAIRFSRSPMPFPPVA